MYCNNFSNKQTQITARTHTHCNIEPLQMKHILSTFTSMSLAGKAYSVQV